MGTQARPVSEARVAMATPARTLAQLCKHFAHKVPTTLAEDRGSIEFPAGTCALGIADGTLVLHLAADDEAGLATLEDVVARHLLRFAFREPPEVRWVRVA